MGIKTERGSGQDIFILYDILMLHNMKSYSDMHIGITKLCDTILLGLYNIRQ